MKNKLVVIVNSLKVPKIMTILLYEMKFLVPNYSCLQNLCLGGYRPRLPPSDPRSLCPQLNLLNPPTRTKFLGTPLQYTQQNLTPVPYVRVAIFHNASAPPKTFDRIIRHQVTSSVYTLPKTSENSVLINCPVLSSISDILPA